MPEIDGMDIDEPVVLEVFKHRCQPSGGDVWINLKSREVCQPHTRQGEFQHCIAVTRQSAAGREGEVCSVYPLHLRPPVVHAMIAKSDPFMSSEIGGRFGNAARGEIVWRCDDLHFRLSQLAGHQA